VSRAPRGTHFRYHRWLFGLLGAAFALTVGGVGEAVEAEGASQVVSQGWAAVALSFVGLLGAALALARPRLASLLMLIAGIGGIIAISVAYVFGGILLIVSSILAFLGRKSTRQAE